MRLARPWRSYHALALVAAAGIVGSVHSGCGGGTGTGNPINGNVTVQSAPFAGPNAAFNGPGLLERLLGFETAFAAPPTCQFAVFNACNDTFIFYDASGVQLNVNGSTNPSVGQGLLQFSSANTQPMSIGSLNIPGGTVISEIDITFAKVPTVCNGAAYAVEFDSGNGNMQTVTQNTAFKFKYGTTGLTINGSAQTLTLMFGQIVNQMCSLAQAGNLNNSTIQTIPAGSFQ